MYFLSRTTVHKYELMDLSYLLLVIVNVPKIRSTHIDVVHDEK